MNAIAAGHVLASFSITAGPGANGILVLIALILFFVAALLAVIIKPVNWWAVLTAAGLGVYMLALLIGT